MGEGPSGYNVSPIQSDALSHIAARLNATAMQIALAWLLHRSPNMLLIPGTSSVVHLRENLKAAEIALSDDALRELNAIGRGGSWGSFRG
jgi:aryl-alcohol dehydrogenase-like predicted oxidoreductase